MGGRLLRQTHWSPDGRWIAARGADTEARWGIYLIDAESGDAERIIRGQRVTWPHWSADGSAIFYLSRPRAAARNADNGADQQVPVD